MGKLAVEPGIYPDVDFDQYLAWDAVSNSTLKTIDRSPAHCKAWANLPQKVTDAKRLGSAAHTAVFEPERYQEEYVVLPELNLRTKAGREEKQVYINRYGEENLLKLSEFEMISQLQESVFSHPIASKYFEPIDDAELSVAFPYRDILCKGRYDGVCFKEHAIVDLKTTKNAEPSTFYKNDFIGYKYYRQAALYLRGAHELGIAVNKFIFIAVEKEPPFGVTVLEPTEEDLKLGQVENDEALDKYRYCVQNNHWPSYPNEVFRGTLPGYLQEKLEWRTSK